MICIVDGAGITNFQPRENRDVQVVVERVFHLVAAEIV